jgi:hypothetical protein
LARVAVDLTNNAVDLVGIRAQAGCGIANIVGAVVVVTAIDVAAEFGLLTHPGPAYTRNAVEVALGTVWPVVVQARAVGEVTDVFGARVVVVALDAFTKPYAQAGGALAGVLAKLARGAVRSVRMVAAAIGRIAHIVGTRVAVTAIHTFAKPHAHANHALTGIAIHGASRPLRQRRIDTVTIDRITDVLGTFVVVVAIDAFAEASLAALHQQDQTKREQRQESE